jgi:putative endonuclease
VAREGDTVVFVEVRERADASHGAAVETVTRAKRRRVIRAAETWAAARGATEGRIRFDVVAIDHEPATGRALIRHERGAFDADGE